MKNRVQRVHGRVARLWGVIQRGDRAGLALESFAELLRGEFYGYDAVRAGVQTAVDLSHTARAQQADNLVRAKPGAGR